MFDVSLRTSTTNAPFVRRVLYAVCSLRLFFISKKLLFIPIPYKNVDGNITYNLAIERHLLESTQLKISCINRKIFANALSMYTYTLFV